MLLSLHSPTDAKRKRKRKRKNSKLAKLLWAKLYLPPTWRTINIKPAPPPLRFIQEAQWLDEWAETQYNRPILKKKQAASCCCNVAG